MVTSISKKLAKCIGAVIEVNFEKISLDEFHMGINVELEHGTKLGSKTDVTKNDLVATGKIALAHLLELPDYYTRLKEMEKSAELKEMIQKVVRELLEGVPD